MDEMSGLACESPIDSLLRELNLRRELKQQQSLWEYFRMSCSRLI